MSGLLCLLTLDIGDGKDGEMSSTVAEMIKPGPGDYRILLLDGASEDFLMEVLDTLEDSPFDLHITGLLNPGRNLSDSRIDEVYFLERDEEFQLRMPRSADLRRRLFDIVLILHPGEELRLGDISSLRLRFLRGWFLFESLFHGRRHEPVRKHQLRLILRVLSHLTDVTVSLPFVLIFLFRVTVMKIIREWKK